MRQPYPVSLPEQSLADSLNTIAKQGRVQILFDANAIKTYGLLHSLVNMKPIPHYKRC